MRDARTVYCHNSRFPASIESILSLLTFCVRVGVFAAILRVGIKSVIRHARKSGDQDRN